MKHFKGGASCKSLGTSDLYRGHLAVVPLQSANTTNTVTERRRRLSHVVGTATK
jgi:hypothetical protein